MRDYSVMDSSANVMFEEFRNISSQKSGSTDYYRYSRCKLFNPKPSSSGICHTFNALELKTILKASKWADDFLDSFSAFDEHEVFKSAGVKVEKGFVFSLDTMQSYMFSLQDNIDSEKDINSFLIKVHPAGEIPWMAKDSQTFKRISAVENDMSTRFITVSGDIITSEVGFDYLNVININE